MKIDPKQFEGLRDSINRLESALFDWHITVAKALAHVRYRENQLMVRMAAAARKALGIKSPWNAWPDQDELESGFESVRGRLLGDGVLAKVDMNKAITPATHRYTTIDEAIQDCRTAADHAAN